MSERERLAGFLSDMAPEAAAYGFSARDLRAAAAALRSAPPADGWRPIESAPKDGMRLVGFDPIGGVAIFHWDPDREWWAWDDGDTGSQPTLWTPLPGEPEQPASLPLRRIKCWMQPGPLRRLLKSVADGKPAYELLQTYSDHQSDVPVSLLILPGSPSTQTEDE